MGFVKLAIRSGVPIVPVATVGGPDSMPVLATGRRMARALRLDRVTRIKMFPIAIQAPWGLSPALLPEIPLPTKIRTAFLEPIALDRGPEEVCDSIQRGMDALARRRRLALSG
jgi:1-acyl-sn-glycerol-3-phosphate acyltransferase